MPGDNLTMVDVELEDDKVKRQEATAKFGKAIPLRLGASIVRKVTSMGPGNLAALLKDQDLTNASAGVDLVTKDILVKNPISVAALGAAAASVDCVEEDVHRQSIKKRKVSSEGESVQYDDEEVYLTEGVEGKGSLSPQEARGRAGAPSNKGYTVCFANKKTPNQIRNVENEKTICMELKRREFSQ